MNRKVREKEKARFGDIQEVKEKTDGEARRNRKRKVHERGVTDRFPYNT